MTKYSNPIYQQFYEELTKAGYEVITEYNGRFFYKGPAVTVKDLDEFHDVIRATKVRVQKDNLGLGYIVYPK